MKKIFFLAAMLISIGAAAQQRTFVNSVSTNYNNQQVTFSISWEAGSRGTYSGKIYHSKVWVFVDYQEMIDDAPYGNWERADIDISNLPPNCTAVGTNTKGFWYQGATSGEQNDTLTVTLNIEPNKFKWCAFALDYPPNVTYTGNNLVTFKGTLPFSVTYTDNTVELFTAKTNQSVTNAMASVTDATGCPCIINCVPGQSDPASAIIHWNQTHTFNLGTATVGNGTYSYQWQQSANGTSGWANVANSPSTNATYTTPPLTGSSYYRRVVTSCGNSATSTAAFVQNTFVRPSTMTVTSTSCGFVNNTTWRVGSQTWSAPVTCTQCRKITYVSNSTVAPYMVDCRSNNDASAAVNATYGDVFTWGMVIQHADMLCKSPWRVPSKGDLVSVPLGLGASSVECPLPAAIRNKALSSATDGTGWAFTLGAYYDAGVYTNCCRGFEGEIWSNSMDEKSGACYAGYYQPSGSMCFGSCGLRKWLYTTVRCVRD